MLMLCLGIACIHILSVKALPEPSLESSVNCTLLFLYTVSGRNRMTAMAKVRLLAVLTMDGCPAETTCLSGRWLGSDQYGIGALKEAATCVLTEDTSLTLRRQWKDGMVRIAYGRKTPRQRVVTFGK